MRDTLKYPFIQAAGVKTLNEANLLIDAGFNYIGFPLVLDFHTPDITVDETKEIIAKVKDKVDSILITYLDKASEILALMDFLDVNIVQIHGNISLEEIELLRKWNTTVIIIKSLVIKNGNIDVLSRLILNIEPYVDAFITDTYDTDTGASGATGKTHDWALSKHLKEITNKPLILAGGLNPQNVYGAIDAVRPFGVDVHTGIEKSDGSKSQSLSTKFIQNAISSFSI